MSNAKKLAGNRGEALAEAFLKKQGYNVIERNFRTRNGEIDIIAVDRSEKEAVLVFVEVKTRISTEYGTPLEAIGYYKLQALMRTADYYKATHKKLPDLMRLDAVAIILTPEGKVHNINLVKNIS